MITVSKSKEQIIGRMGRLWQSLILARWNPLFADIPVESPIFEHQEDPGRTRLTHCTKKIRVGPD
jgi:hypothetical protein